ncbi:glycosyltransferase [Winogradskyella sp. 3972H.M.0a.05]|uniref:glycosyltransferase family 2 protein n=1 Tax=Winogradskyella sp. 3972H.M.0a.05 TaxID=2950277 RepID=UPI003393067F
MKPDISVVIPCYNMGSFVLEAVQSVLDYTGKYQIEIIVVNDGSNDNGFTKSVLDGIEDERVRIIHQENKGLGNTRNIGVKESNADYVVPLDADNKLRSAYIDKGIEIMKANSQVGVVYGDNHQFGVSNGLVTIGEFDISRLIYKNYIDACVLLRKAAWESVGGYDGEMPVMGYEDWDINMRLFFKGWQFQYINDLAFDYRVREDSMLQNSNKNRDMLIEYMFEKPELQQAKKLREKIIDGASYKEAYEAIQKRKLIKLAIKLEKPLKKIKGIVK